MRNYTILAGQNLADIAIQELGGLAALVSLAELNGMSITAELEPGSSILIDDALAVDTALVRYFQSREVFIATGELEDTVTPVSPIVATTFSPSMNAVNVTVDTNPFILFNQIVTPGAATAILYKKVAGVLVLVRNYTFAGGDVSFVGAKVTFANTGLTHNDEAVLIIPPGFVTNSSGDSWAGVDWTWMVRDTFRITSQIPGDQGDYEPGNAYLWPILSLNRAFIVNPTGTVWLKNWANGLTLQTFSLDPSYENITWRKLSNPFGLGPSIQFLNINYASGGHYYIETDVECFEDTANSGEYLEPIEAESWEILLPTDTAGPVLDASNPLDGGTIDLASFSPQYLFLTFDKPVRWHSGSMYLKRSDGVLLTLSGLNQPGSDGLYVDTDAELGQITNTLALDVTGVLQAGFTYKLYGQTNAIKSWLDYYWAGLVEASAIDFTVIDSNAGPQAFSTGFSQGFN